jgi:lipid-binding SYLF domain-containing protein
MSFLKMPILKMPAVLKTSLAKSLVVALLALFAVATVSISSATPSQAQGAISIRIIKGGWFIGGAGGSGTLRLGRRAYPLTVGGLSAGLVFGGSLTDLSGSVHNIRDPRDINGVYYAVGAGAAVGGGVQVMQLQNSRGVVLQLRGTKVGLEFALDLSGMALQLR